MMDDATDLTMDRLFSQRNFISFDDWPHRYPWENKENRWFTDMLKADFYYPWDNKRTYNGGTIEYTMDFDTGGISTTHRHVNGEVFNNRIVNTNFYGTFENPFIMGSCAQRKEAAKYIEMYANEEMGIKGTCQRCGANIGIFDKIFESKITCSICNEGFEMDIYQPVDFYANLNDRLLGRRQLTDGDLVRQISAPRELVA